MASKRETSIAIWLLICALCVAVMVGVGGLTRLTESGLSITEWKPISGTIPPLSHKEWEESFALYKTIPEYQQVNYGMSLEQYKQIYWLEYLHRLLGRLTGVIFFVPFVVLLAFRQFSFSEATRLGVIFLLGALQGFMGWYMVKSGLSVRTDVSHIRLMFHLVLAFIIFGFLFWNSLSYFAKSGLRREPTLAQTLYNDVTWNFWLRLIMPMVLGLVLLQVATGALVAGTHAGLIYNTFPKMNEYWVPPETYALKPWTMNLLYNVTTLQFHHRMLAIIIALLSIASWQRVVFHKFAQSTPKPILFRMSLVVVTVCGQFALGVITLLNQVPIPLASLHQLGGLVVFASVLWLVHGVVTLRRVRQLAEHG